MQEIGLETQRVEVRIVGELSGQRGAVCCGRVDGDEVLRHRPGRWQ